MKNNYKRLGDYIQLVNERNSENLDIPLMGLTIDKKFIPSVANTIGTDLTKYKVVYKNQFACSLMQVSRDGKMPIARLNEEMVIMSPAYPIFKVTKPEELLPEYLEMWFKREEFDREAAYYAVGGVRGNLTWEDFCDLTLPIPSPEKQQEIVADYQAVEQKIKTNETICEKLEETAQTIYRRWFEEFEFPDENGKPYKTNGGKMVWNDELEKDVPEGWEVKKLEEISTIIMGQSPKGSSYNEDAEGTIFYQGRTDFGFRIPEVRMYTTSPKRKAKEGDVLMSVRAPVGDLNIAKEDCCIGRGLAAIRNDEISYLFYLLKSFKQLFDTNKGTGTIFSSINKTELHQLAFIYDKKVSILFNDIISELDNDIIEYCKQIKKLEQLQSLLLARMTREEELEKV